MRGVEACRTVLTVIEEHYAAESVELPGRRFVAAGVVPYDCDEQLSVSFIGFYSPSIVGGEPAPANEIVVEHFDLQSTYMEIVILRCAPLVKEVAGQFVMPSIAEMETYAEGVERDGRMITDALWAAWSAGRFGENPAMSLEDYGAVGPDGDVGGGAMRVRLGV